jgi:hypothetical protein
LEIEMNKLLSTLMAGAIALTLGSSAFAADAVKATKVAEPAKVEAPVAVEAAKVAAPTEAAAKPEKKHHHKDHAKKPAAAPSAEVAPEPAK